MKKIIFLLCTLLFSFIMNSCIVQNPRPENCIVKEITVTEIEEGSFYDIVFKDEGNNRYYINRGLEFGLRLKDLKQVVLNKKVTLHLPKFWIGTSEQIAQLKLDEDILYSEFN